MRILLFGLILFGCSFAAQADQLAYLPKQDAEKAAEFIKTQEFIYLYCGCCDAHESPVKIKPVSVEVRYTNYEDFYQVVVTYEDASGAIQTEFTDLAYTWVKKKRKMLTVGAVMDFEHDRCHSFPKK